MGGTPPKKIFKAEVTSKDKIEEGKWHRVAVTYDLKKIRLYLDGKLQGEADAPPSEGHEWITHLIVGGLCNGFGFPQIISMVISVISGFTEERLLRKNSSEPKKRPGMSSGSNICS